MSISRRTVLAGLGVGAGAAAVGPGIASAAADDQRAGEGAGAAAPLVPAVITPGLDYLILGGSSFMGRSNDIFFASGTASVYTTGTFIDCHFGLPVGSTLKEVEIFASGTGSITAGVFEVTAAGVVNLTPLGAATVAGGSSMTIELDESVDGNRLFLIEIEDTSPTLRFQTARVGFIPPYRRVVTVNPQQRVYDSRSLTKIANEVERVIDLSSVVPVGATAAIVNLTTTLQDALGYLSLFPGDKTWPGTSSINYVAAQDTANSSIVGLSETGRTIKVRCGGGATHFIIDVTGYLI